MDDELPVDERVPFHPLTTCVFVLLIALALVVNFLVPMGTWRYRSFESNRFCFAMGFVISEVSLLAIWDAVANQARFVRIPLVFFSFFGLATVFYAAAMRLWRTCFPDTACLGVIAAAVLMVAVYSSLRWFNGKCVLTKQRGTQFVSRRMGRFGVRELLVLTAMVAVFVQFWVVNSFEQLDWGDPDLGPTIVFLVFLLFHSLWFVLLCFGVVFAERYRPAFVVILVASLFVFSLLTSIPLFYLIELEADWGLRLPVLFSPTALSRIEILKQMFGNTFSYTASLVFSNLFVLTIFYLIGYRNRLITFADLSARS